MSSFAASNTAGAAADAAVIGVTKDATAIGSGATVSADNGVALGAKSTAGASNTGTENGGGASAYSIAGSALTNQLDANGVVSVSGGGINRQITGVADGVVVELQPGSVLLVQVIYS